MLLLAERPEDLGLRPDGDPPRRPSPEGRAPVPSPSVPSTGNQASENLAASSPPPRSAADDRERASDSWTVPETLRTASFWILALMGLATFFVQSGVNVHIAAYLRDQGLSLTNAAAVVTAGWVVSAAGSVGWGWLMERLPARWLYSAMLALLAGSVLLLLLVGGIGGALASAGLIGLVAAGGNITPAVVYADYYGRASLGRIRGLAEIGVLIGQSTGPLLAGVAYDLSGSYTLIFLIFAAIAAAGSLLVLYARRPVRGGGLAGQGYIT